MRSEREGRTLDTSGRENGTEFAIRMLFTVLVIRLGLLPFGRTLQMAHQAGVMRATSPGLVLDGVFDRWNKVVKVVVEKRMDD